MCRKSLTKVSQMKNLDAHALTLDDLADVFSQLATPAELAMCKAEEYWNWAMSDTGEWKYFFLPENGRKQ